MRILLGTWSWVLLRILLGTRTGMCLLHLPHVDSVLSNLHLLGDDNTKKIMYNSERTQFGIILSVRLLASSVASVHTHETFYRRRIIPPQSPFDNVECRLTPIRNVAETVPHVGCALCHQQTNQQSQFDSPLERHKHHGQRGTQARQVHNGRRPSLLIKHILELPFGPTQKERRSQGENVTRRVVHCKRNGPALFSLI